MRVVEYVGKALPDGHLSLPDEVQKELGLSPHSSVKVTIAVEDSHELDEQEGWKVFRQLGQNAVSGRLPDASTKHDLYLYGKKK